MLIEHAPAGLYLGALTGSIDGPATFQTFHDSDKSKGAMLLHGALDEHWESLCRLNLAGHGIYCCVNQTDLQGRRSGNVTALRALFIDDDGSNPVRFGDARLAACPPSMTVQSRAGQHQYWLLQPGEPLARFTPAQEQLARHFGSDPKVKDLPRVLRIPGFLHQKSEPFRVKLLQANAARYSIDEVLAAYPAPLPEPVAPPVDRRGTLLDRPAIERAARYCDATPGALQGGGGDEHTFKLACALVRGFDLADDEALELLESWNAKCVPPWSERELVTKLQTARRSGKEPIGSRLKRSVAGPSDYQRGLADGATRERDRCRAICARCKWRRR